VPIRRVVATRPFRGDAPCLCRLQSEAIRGKQR
jgi:hypothetical protein